MRRDMASIRSKDTRPELAVRSIAHRLGYRFRLHKKDLPGSPDLVFAGRRKVILVHGCFWHRHTCRLGQKVPSSKHDYWLPKFERNKLRDARVLAELADLGWGSLVLWECELSEPAKVRQRIRRFLGKPKRASATRP
jgi:DNA mismatch endonuclease (patch repair protein)